MVANLNFGFEFTVCEILFGFPNHSVPDVEILKLELMIGGAAVVGREILPWQSALYEVL